MGHLKGEYSSRASSPTRAERDELEMLARSIHSSSVATREEPLWQEPIRVRPDPGISMQLPHVDEYPSAFGDEIPVHRTVLITFVRNGEGAWWIQTESFLDNGLEVRQTIDIRSLGPSLPPNFEI